MIWWIVLLAVLGVAIWWCFKLAKVLNLFDSANDEEDWR